MVNRVSSYFQNDDHSATQTELKYYRHTKGDTSPKHRQQSCSNKYAPKTIILFNFYLNFRADAIFVSVWKFCFCGELVTLIQLAEKLSSRHPINDVMNTERWFHWLNSCLLAFGKELR